MAEALRARGVADLAAQSAVTVFIVAFGQWVAEDETRSLADLERGALAELSRVLSP